VDPEGLSLEQVLCAVNFMAKFHAIGSALISKKLKSIQLRHPYLLNNVYGSPMMIEGAKKIFDLYAEFLSYVPDQQDLLEKFNKHCQVSIYMQTQKSLKEVSLVANIEPTFLKSLLTYISICTLCGLL